MPSFSTPNLHPDPAVQAIDALYRQAGLVRSLRANSAGGVRRARLERAAQKSLSQDDLRQAAPVPRVATNGVQWLTVHGWEKIPWLWHGFSTRRGGVSRSYCAEDAPGELNLGFTDADDREAVARNRLLLAEAVTGDQATPLVTVRQIHSSVLRLATGDSARDLREIVSKIRLVSGHDFSRAEKGCKMQRALAPERLQPTSAESVLIKAPVKGDGLMTDESGLLLGIQTADCIPVLVADRKRRAVAAFHAGWRGTVKRIVETGVGRMRLEFGSRPEDLIAAIGPGIGPCCYAVGDEVLSSFESQFRYAGELFCEVYDTDPVRTKYPMLFLTQRAPGHSPIGPSLHVDLIEANRRQLLDAGLKPQSIKSVGGCTSCQPELFFSHRASRGHAGRMLSVIGIRPR
jgi:YfiH family protein